MQLDSHEIDKSRLKIWIFVLLLTLENSDKLVQCKTFKVMVDNYIQYHTRNIGMF